MIYKFFNPSPLSISMLRRGEIFFATSEELNDVNELHADHVFNGHKNSWFRLMQLIFFACIETARGNGAPRTEAGQIKQLAADAAEKAFVRFRRRDVRTSEICEFLLNYLHRSKETSTLAREITEEVRAVVNEKIAGQLRQNASIASFTRTATNPTIWGHYASAGKGFGIIYAPQGNAIRVKTLSDSNITGVFTDLKRKKAVIKYSRDFEVKLEEVIYRKKPPKLNGFHVLSWLLASDPESDDLDESTLYFKKIKTKEFKKSKQIKYTDWRYENEVRAILPYTPSRAAESATRIVEVAPEHIIGIILGHNISDKDLQSCLRALEILRNHVPKSGGFGSRLIAVLRAERQHNSLKARITPFAGLTSQMQMRKYKDSSHQLKPAHRKYLDQLCKEINDQE